MIIFIIPWESVNSSSFWADWSWQNKGTQIINNPIKSFFFYFKYTSMHTFKTQFNQIYV